MYFSDHGLGVGLRPKHFSHFQNQKPESVSWVEVVTENFLPWVDGTRLEAQKTLENVRSLCPVALHGVSMNLGSSDPLNFDYLKRLKSLVRTIDPMVVSDHLCWTGINKINLHDLLPLPYNESVIQHVSKRIEQVQNFLGRRILIENLSSYVEYSSSEMTEWEFLSEIANRSDCGILLDVNNVYVSSVNHRFDPHQYLMGIPKNRVGQMHLAGHSVRDGYLIDTHDTPVCAEVWNLYRYAIDRFGKISTMIERDDHIPEWNELECEILKAGKTRESQNGTQRNSEPVSASIAL